MPMERFDRLLRAAQALAPPERAAFLETACPDDEDLRRDLERMFYENTETEVGPTPETLAAKRILPIREEEPTRVGQRIGPYNVERQLGHGGMGEVYRGLREEPFKQYVAIKVIRQGMNTREVLQRFEMERHILASLDHPHIARLIDGGRTEDGLPYLVMDYVDGIPIDTYCDRHKLSLEDRIGLFRDVCAAIQYAHQNLVVHRDLKPSNILVTSTGEIKLLDFGIAKVLNPHLTPGDVPITRTNLRMMTPEYASPEQVKGEAITTASDVYALGVLLYELLTGHRPYRLKQRMLHEIARIIVEEEPTRPSTVVTQVEETLNKETLSPRVIGENRSLAAEQLKKRLRGDLDNIVMKALQKRPVYRYATVKELSDDLERHLDGLPVLAQAGSAAYRVHKFVRRHRVSVVAASLVLVSLVGGLGAALWQATVADRARVQAEEERARSQQVVQYLEGVFSAAAPANRRPGSLTARELLDRGVERIDDELSDQPGLQAAMLTTLGRVYTKLSVLDTAQVMLDRSLALRQQSQHPSDLAESYTALADLNSFRSAYTEADSMYRLALGYHKAMQSERPEQGQTLIRYAGMLSRRGHHDDALVRAREGIALLRATLGSDHLQTVQALSQLITIRTRWHGSRPLNHSAADYKESARIGHEVLAAMNRQYGEQDAHVGQAYRQLAMVYMFWVAHDEVAPPVDSLLALAIDLNRREGEIVDATYGRESARYIGVLGWRATILSKQEDIGAAAVINREIYDIARVVYGPRHSRLSDYAHNLQLRLSQIGLVDSALRVAEESVAILDRAGMTINGVYVSRWIDVGSRADQAGNQERACSAYRAAIQIVEALPSGDVASYHKGQVQGGVGVCLVFENRDDEAEALLQEGYAILAESPYEWWDILYSKRRVLEALVELYQRQGRAEEAATYEALRQEML